MAGSASLASIEAAGSTPATRSSRSVSRGRSRKHHSPFIINTVDCVGKSSKDLYSSVATVLGWEEVDVEAKNTPKVARPTIFCLMQTADLLRRVPSLGPGLWASRYVGAPDVCDKGNLARMFKACQTLCGQEHFAFNPPTWVLPEQLDELRGVLDTSRGTYIVKPEDGSQGDGIFLVQGLRDLDVKLSVKRDCAAVVQKYISKPLLLNGLKFDLRMYVFVLGGATTREPMVFLSREGLARFCTEAYEAPAHGNMHKCMSHLTNYSLNKRSDKFEHCSEAMEEVFSDSNSSSKRPLSVALRQLAAEYPDFCAESFYAKVAEVVQSTVAVMAVAMRAYHRGVTEATDEMHSFQVFGFDIILDEQYNCFLLEVNNAPSLCIDEALPFEDPTDAAPAGRMGGRTREKEKPCRCMDMAQVHWHKTSLVDLAVKQAVVQGAFETLDLLTKGQQSCASNYIPVPVLEDALWSTLTSLELLYSRAGGAAKAFTTSGLRRILGGLCSPGSLEKHDLDVLAQRYRPTNFVTHDRDSKPDALRLFDYITLLLYVVGRAFPHLTAPDGLAQALQILQVN
mmetsp:Transcript_10448/g.18832  ORF Transcript_10448/g.18832 Transcript_10448/m.18832 type:complete len:567 (+) Transcript_10448:114-1814(+)